MVRPIAARVSAEAEALATVRLNSCLVNFMPPAKNEKPSTNNRFPMIEPVIDALTTPSKPLAIANKAMMSSAALPKVAFNKLPTPEPRCLAKCSVDRPIQAANGIIAKQETMKRKVALCNAGKERMTIATGTNTNSQSSDGLIHERDPTITNEFWRRREGCRSSDGFGTETMYHTLAQSKHPSS